MDKEKVLEKNKEVLGFEREDGYWKTAEEQFMGHQIIEIEEIDLIPVISFKQLKKLCKKHALLSGIKPNLIDIDELLKAVEEEMK